MRWSPEDRAALERDRPALLSAGARVVAVARNQVEDLPAGADWIQGGRKQRGRRAGDRRTDVCDSWRRGHFDE
jgi:hypothetical protein